MAGLVCFFNVKAFLMSAIVTVKIVCSGFLTSHTNGVALIIWMSRVLSELWSSIVSYAGSSLVSGSVSGSVSSTELVSNSGSLSILFIVEN